MSCRSSTGEDIIKIVDILLNDIKLMHKFVNGEADETVLLGDPPNEEETATLRNLALQVKWLLKHYLEEFSKVVDPFRYDSYAFNVRRSMTTEQEYPKGSIITIPANYYPQRDILFVSVGGLVLTPKKEDDWDDGERQYEEVGDSPNVQSNKIKISFDLKEGEVVDVWVVASNLMRELATIAGMAQVSTDKAAEAEDYRDEAKYWADYAEKLVGDGVMESGVANLRRSWAATEDVPAGGILKLPIEYYPLRAVVLFSYKGLLCAPKDMFLNQEGRYCYEEIGDDPSVKSDELRVFFDITKGDELDLWVCASSVGRNIEAIQAAKDEAVDAAERAKKAVDNLQTQVLTKDVDYVVQDETTKGKHTLFNPHTGDITVQYKPIPLAVAPVEDVTAGNDGLMPKESLAQLNTNTADISALKGRITQYAVHLGETRVESQTELYDAFLSVSGASDGTVPLDGTTLINLDEFDGSGAEYTYFVSSGKWEYRGQTTVGMATNTSLGIVKGSISVIKGTDEVLGSLKVTMPSIKATFDNNTAPYMSATFDMSITLDGEAHTISASMDTAPEEGEAETLSEDEESAYDQFYDQIVAELDAISETNSFSDDGEDCVLELTSTETPPLGVFVVSDISFSFTGIEEATTEEVETLSEDSQPDVEFDDSDCDIEIIAPVVYVPDEQINAGKVEVLSDGSMKVIGFVPGGNDEYTGKPWGIALDGEFPEDETEIAERLPVGGFVTGLMPNGIEDAIPAPYNTEETITESGTWTAKVTGWHNITTIDGGSGCYVNPTTGRGTGGAAGTRRHYFLWLEKGDQVPVTVGSGGLGNHTTSFADTYGGATTFGNPVSVVTDSWSPNQSNITSVSADFNGTGPNSTRAWGWHDSPNGHNNALDGTFPGGGGGGLIVSTSPTVYYYGNGAPGAVIIRYYDPTKDTSLSIGDQLVTDLYARLAALEAKVNELEGE